MPKIRLQPKQYEALQLIESGDARWIGLGGGRGAAKSAGIDRIALTLGLANPGCLMSIVMRNFDQVRKYHIEPMLRAFPELEEYYIASKYKQRIPAGRQFSEIDFSYAENYDDVERRFRSGNYRYIFVDQAEQFMDTELREMFKACRSPQGTSKMILAFNMGGIGIQALRKWFHDHEYNERQDPHDYVFLKVNPWDNVEWVRPALEADGLTEKDYYSWTDHERMSYAATRGEYTRGLDQDDDSIRARDWLGSWESLEGAFFGRVFDRASTLVSDVQVKQILEPWDTRWISQDWGKAHFCSTHWHGRTVLSPSKVKQILGWDVQRPLGVVVTYRERIVSEKTSSEVGQDIVAFTPEKERERIKRYFLSPDAFGERDSKNTIAILQGNELHPYGMPRPEKADNDRIGGWALMSNLMLETKRHGSSEDDQDVWLISSECPELLNTIPLLMRDKKNIDDVLKTDKGNARIEQDVADDVRYGLKSMLAPNLSIPVQVQAERLKASISDPHNRSMAMREFEYKVKQGRRRVSSWRRS